MEAIVDMTEIGRRAEIKFDVKIKKMVEFKVRPWLFIRLVKLAGWILGSIIVIDINKEEQA